MAFVPLGSKPAVNRAPTTDSMPLSGGVLTNRTGSTRPMYGATPYAATSSFGPGNDLQGTQITSSASPMTAQAQGATAQAVGQVSGQQLSPWQSVAPFTSSSTAQYGAIQPVNTQTAGTTDPTAAYGLLGQAAGAVGGSNMQQGLTALTGLTGGGGGFSYGGPQADVGKARSSTMTALDSAMNGPDRLALANDAYNQLVERSNPQFEADTRALAAKQTALGRAGSGMVNTALADLGTARDRELSLARQELSTNAAGQTLADRLALVSAAQGVASGFAGDDRADAGLNLSGAQLAESAKGRQLSAANSLIGAEQGNASLLRGLGNDRFGIDSTITGQRGADADRLNSGSQFNSGLLERKAQFGYNADRDTYNSQVGERDAARADEYNQGQYGLSKLSGLSNYLSGREGEDRANRNELRGERSYQNALAEQAKADDYQSAQFDEWLRNSRAGRLGGYAGIGYGGDPSAAYMSAANSYGNQASSTTASLGPMMAYLAQLRQQPGGN